jgi:cellobiose PTS system EIIC component
MKADSAVDRFQSVATRIQENRYIKAISGGFIATLPVLMFGAICALIVGFPVPAWSEWIRTTPLGDALQLGNAATIGLLALYVVVGVSYALARELKQDPLAAVATSLLAFLLILPFNTQFTPDGGEPIDVTGVLPTQWLGPQGVFTALIVGLIATRVYAWIIDRGWKIRLPASVPPAVSRPFEAIIPGAIIGTVFLVIRTLVGLTPYEHVGNFIFTMIGQPIGALGTSFWAWFVIILISQLCWAIGIHNAAIWGVITPIMLPPMLENQAAGAAGDPLPYLVTITFVMAITQWVGGPGNLIGLSTNMILFAKSKRYKTLGRLSFPPSIFNIIEPIMFGFPIVFNPLLVIPFVLVPLVSYTVGYLLLSIGIIGNPWVALPASVFTMPFVPGGFILGAGIAFGIFLVAVYLFSVVSYYPFFRIADRRELKLETAAAAEAQVAEERHASAHTDASAPLAGPDPSAAAESSTPRKDRS